MRRYHRGCLLFLLATLFHTPTILAEPVLVVKKSFPLDSITIKQATNLWLAETKSLQNLRPIFVVDLVETHPLNMEFYSKIIHITPKELEIYWDKKLFSGRVVKPKTVETELDVIQMVTSISGVIGYIDRESVTFELKILDIKE